MIANLAEGQIQNAAPQFRDIRVTVPPGNAPAPANLGRADLGRHELGPP
jgi:hypothetical protein